MNVPFRSPSARDDPWESSLPAAEAQLENCIVSLSHVQILVQFWLNWLFFSVTLQCIQPTGVNSVVVVTGMLNPTITKSNHINSSNCCCLGGYDSESLILNATLTCLRSLQVNCVAFLWTHNSPWKLYIFYLQEDEWFTWISEKLINLSRPIIKCLMSSPILFIIFIVQYLLFNILFNIYKNTVNY